MEVSVISKRSENSMLNSASLRNARFREVHAKNSEGNFSSGNADNSDKGNSRGDKVDTYDSENNFIGNSNYLDSKFISNDGTKNFFDSNNPTSKK